MGWRVPTVRLPGLRARGPFRPPPILACSNSGMTTTGLAGQVVAGRFAWYRPSPVDHGLTHVTPLFGDGPVGRAMLASVWRDIPIAVEAIRKNWMPTRFKTLGSKPPRRSSYSVISSKTLHQRLSLERRPTASAVRRHLPIQLKQVAGSAERTAGFAQRRLAGRRQRSGHR